MKTFLVLLAAALPHLLRAQESQSFSNAERGPHHRVWQKQALVETESGTRTNISGYTELATGLHYWDGAQWQDSREEIEAVADGAAAIHGIHRWRVHE